MRGLGVDAGEEAGDLGHAGDRGQPPDHRGLERGRAQTECLTDLARRVRHEGIQHDAEEAERVGERAQHTLEPGPPGRVLGQRPRSARVHVAVHAADEGPDPAERLLEREVLHRLLDHGPRLRGGGRDLAVGGLYRPGHLRHGTGGGDQRGRAARQVAEVVGQIRVETIHEGLLAEARVEAEVHLAQEEVAEGVVAVLIGELEGLHHVADGLRHLAPAERPVAVDVEPPVERDPGRLQHGRPVDAVRLQDILGDQVLNVLPEPARLLIARIRDCRVIVDQRVEPDIGHVLVVEGQRNAPLEPRAGPADRQILKRLAQEAEHLVPVPVGLDEPRIVLQVLHQPRLVLRHLEEVVLLLDEGERGLVIGALAVHDLLLGVEPLAAVAIPAAVLAEVDLARVEETLQDLLHHFLVPRLGGADEVVVGDAQPPPRLAEDRRDLVRVGLRRLPGRGRHLGDPLAVLVGAGEEVHAVACEAAVAAHRVGHDGGARVPEVRARVDVVDRGREVEGAHAPGGPALRPA